MFPISFKPRRACAGALLGLSLWSVGTAGSAQGQPTPATATAAVNVTEASSPTLRQALDAAWALSPQSRAAPQRLAELQARQQAAQSLIAGAPTVTLAHRTDQVNANGGLREYEAELALPLWNPGVRASTQRQIAAERAAFEPQRALARLKLAGELRELAAGVMLARIEQDLAVRKHDETQRLAQDVQRRVRAGDTARVDALQAQAAAQQAESARVQADGSLLKLQGQWRALTGLSGVPVLAEAAETAAPTPTPNATSDNHPALQAAQALTQSAQARLALAQTDQRDPMELALGIGHERSAFGASADTSLRVALRIPLGGENRNAPKIAAARADLDAAQAEADAATRQVQADQAIATAALATARRSEALATVRARLSTEVHALITRSYQLGEGDLPTRLRAENDKFDADLSLARARIDVQRAISQLHQALGLLP